MTFSLLTALLFFSSGPASESLSQGSSREQAANALDSATERTEVFMMSYDIHFGYQLWRSGNRATPLFVRFSNPSVEQAFEEFESDIQNGAHTGKKTYCECTGVLRIEDGIEILLEVRKARLFAE